MALVLSVVILSSSERREAVVVRRSLICLELLSFKLLNSFALASVSSFAVELACLVSSLVFSLSVTVTVADEDDAAIVTVSVPARRGASQSNDSTVKG